MATHTDPPPQAPYEPETEAIPDDGQPFHPALVVIDMQNDFVTGSLPVPGGASILPQVNDLIQLAKFEARIATRDHHPTDHVSFAKTHEKPEFTKIVIYHPEDAKELLGKEQILWPVHCLADTDGAEFIPGLVKDRFDATIMKGTHPSIESYSGFKDIWGKNETDLPGILNERGVTDVFYVGLAGDFCVKYTALDSVEYGFRTWVVVDAVKSISQDEVAWNQMRDKGVRFTKTEDVKKRLA
ncbi:hypothetical protein EST38_g3177 [Candolleomyces aberdarensis]|uniref:nicotinamidase n=1 Tax=Candolleomyces aberdarensis TaxID=2316362 RepID=A0A4Q2DSU2_9AGAR|nr:hypothetical protein EST38_g3177 [Candolleomyces aberdarensis]